MIDCLQEIINAVHARTSAKGNNHGKMIFGFCRTHYRNAIVTCDDFGWLTINTPPVRNSNTVSLEFTGGSEEIKGSKDSPLFLACVNHHMNSVKQRIKTISWTDEHKLDLAAAIKETYGLEL